MSLPLIPLGQGHFVQMVVVSEICIDMALSILLGLPLPGFRPHCRQAFHDGWSELHPFRGSPWPHQFIVSALVKAEAFMAQGVTCWFPVFCHWSACNIRYCRHGRLWSFEKAANHVLHTMAPLESNYSLPVKIQVILLPCSPPPHKPCTLHGIFFPVHALHSYPVVRYLQWLHFKGNSEHKGAVLCCTKPYKVRPTAQITPLILSLSLLSWILKWAEEDCQHHKTEVSFLRGTLM